MDDLPLPVQEECIEGILHPETVDARAGLDEQPFSLGQLVGAKQASGSRPERARDPQAVGQRRLSRVIPGDHETREPMLTMFGHIGPRITIHNAGIIKSTMGKVIFSGAS